jgi:hypothetical protein
LSAEGGLFGLIIQSQKIMAIKLNLCALSACLPNEISFALISSGR